MLKLYYSPFTCSLSPHIALREAGLPFELVRVDTSSKRTAQGDDFLALNPKGYVPALRIGDELLTEGIAILQYIADHAPQSQLAPPAGTFARYRFIEWLSFISTELHKQFSPLFAPATPEEMRTRARALLGQRIAILESALRVGPYLLGERFSLADSYAFVVLRWARLVQVELSPFPAVVAFQARVGERSSVQAAMAAEKHRR